MSTSMRRPVTTYRHRHRHARAAIADVVVQLPPSPLSDPEQDEISMSEMTRRMKKRSHRATLSAPEQLHDHDLSSKKFKYHIPNFGLENDNSPPEQALRNRISFPLNSQIQNDFPFETPGPSLVPSERSMRPSSTRLSQDQLSPVPVMRASMFRRISMRNLKENTQGANSGLDLASPFNSQPNSRTSSPSKAKAKTKRPRTKSRTLSANLVENQADGSLIDPEAQTAFAVPSKKKLKVIHHSRNPSVPSVLNPASPHGWLIQPETLSRAFFQFDQPTQLDLPFPPHPRPLISPPSFLGDNPVAFSTPAVKRSLQPRVQPEIHHVEPRFSVAQLNLQVPSFAEESFAEKCNQLLGNADIDMTDTTVTLESAPPHRRQRKRVEVRLSGDSIFSSMLDSTSASAAATLARPLDIIPSNDQSIVTAPSHRSSTGTMSLTTVFNRSAFDRLSVLAPAFSPLSSGATNPAQGLKELDIAHSKDTPLPSADEADRDTSMQSSPDALDLFRIKDDSDLTTMLSNMGLNKGSLTHNRGFYTDRSHSLPINEGEGNSRGGRGHRRRRDTIRASDFLQGGLGVGGANAVTSKIHGGRTRSGTVTQSSYQAGMEMRMGRDGRMVKIDNGLPLSPPKDDDSGDELLMMGREVGREYDWE